MCVCVCKWYEVLSNTSVHVKLTFCLCYHCTTHHTHTNIVHTIQFDLLWFIFPMEFCKQKTLLHFGLTHVAVWLHQHFLMIIFNFNFIHFFNLFLSFSPTRWAIISISSEKQHNTAYGSVRKWVRISNHSVSEGERNHFKYFRDFSIFPRRRLESFFMLAISPYSYANINWWCGSLPERCQNALAAKSRWLTMKCKWSASFQLMVGWSETGPPIVSNACH